MNFALFSLILFMFLILLILLYPLLPFSLIALRKYFPLFFLFIFIFSLNPFILLIVGIYNCNFHCSFMGHFAFYKELLTLPLISSFFFIFILTYYLKKDFKFKKLRVRRLTFGKNPHGISVIGFFKPFIYIDKGLWSILDRNEKKAIISHEICHIKNRDTLWKMLIHALSLSFFYLLPLLFIKKTFEEITELSADEFVLTKRKDRDSLLKAIAKTIYFQHGFHLNAGFFSSSISKRISFIEGKRKRINILFFVVILFMIAGLLPVPLLSAVNNVCIVSCSSMCGIM